MNEEEYKLAYLYTLGSAGLVLASLIQAVRQWLTQAHLPRIETRYEQSLPVAPSQPLPISLGLDNGRHSTKVFRFPPGITFDHLRKFGDVVAAGRKPTSRALKPEFRHEEYEMWRTWLMVSQYNKAGVLAWYVSAREDWDVTPLGRQLAVQWRCKTPPHPLYARHVKVRVCSKQSNLGAIESGQKPKPIPKI